MWLSLLSGWQFEETFRNTQWRKVKNDKLLERNIVIVIIVTTVFRKCFLTGITFVQLQLQIFFMASVNMCMHIVHSAESLCTYLTYEYTVTVFVNLAMPSKVSFFEHLSTFVTFHLLMQLIVVLF